MEYQAYNHTATLGHWMPRVDLGQISDKVLRQDDVFSVPLGAIGWPPPDKRQQVLVNRGYAEVLSNTYPKGWNQPPPWISQEQVREHSCGPLPPSRSQYTHAHA